MRSEETLRRPPSLRQRSQLVVAAITVSATAVFLPFAGHQLGPTIAFVPAMLAVVACFDVISVYLLVGDYLDNGDRRLLALAWAYVWSLVLMTGYALAFPGVVPGAPLASTTSVAPWLYIGWHAGFPVLLGAAWAPWPRGTAAIAPAGRRTRTAWLSCVFVAMCGSGAIAAVVVSAKQLPVLIQGLDTSRMTQVTAPVALPLVGLALLSAFYGLRGRSGPERWTTAAILVCLCDLTLTYTAHFRYSFGWYVGRGLTLTGAMLIALAILVDFRRLKADTERRAGTDSLTGAANRRTLEGALGAALVRAERVSGWTSVLLLDLDGFKALNDRQGHAAGDRALQDAVIAWSVQLRDGDLLARIGGDEFVVLLAGADRPRARIVADRLNATTPPGVKVSIGLASVLGGSDPAALIAEADADMYAVKTQRSKGLTHTKPAAVQVPSGAPTGLPDRDDLLERLSRTLRSNAGVAVLMVDLDRFHRAKDSLGQAAGGALLQRVADRLTSRLDASDVLARFPEDVLVVMRPGATGASRLAERLSETLREPVQLDGREVFVQASIGMSVITGSSLAAGATAEGLVAEACAALHQAQAKGGGRWEMFDAALRERARASFELENDLRGALARDELQVNYQCIVDLTGTVLCVEALLYWEHPTLGLLEPAVVTAAAERTGLVSVLGEHVLRQACCDAVRWRMNHSALTVTVNISGVQLADERLLGVVSSALAATGLPAGALVLQIRETLLTEDTQVVSEVVTDLVDLGVQLAVAEFGTGNSSLLTLRRYPVDIIRLGRVFVASLGEIDADEAIVSAVIGLAHSLGMHTVAEGVETATQQQALARLGCDQALGCYWSLPVAASEFVIGTPAALFRPAPQQAPPKAASGLLAAQ